MVRQMSWTSHDGLLYGLILV